MKLYCFSCNKLSFVEMIDFLKKTLQKSFIPLPTKIQKHTLLKSPNRYKKHLQQIERRVYRGFFIINEIPTLQLDSFPELTIKLKI